MSFQHKFQQWRFNEYFQTHDSIMKIIPYDPEVIFIGSYNHSWSWNPSDFFYGRGMYMWTCLGNLFVHGKNHFVKQRTAVNDQPTIGQIFEICKQGRITFADVVKGIKENIPAVELTEERCVLVDNLYRWESRMIKNRKVGEYSDAHLDNMAHN